MRANCADWTLQAAWTKNYAILTWRQSTSTKTFVGIEIEKQNDGCGQMINENNKRIFIPQDITSSVLP